MTKIDCAMAQTINAIGAAPPSIAAIVAGRTKMLAPMVVLMMLAVRAGNPIPRTNCASVSAAAAGTNELDIHCE